MFHLTQVTGGLMTRCFFCFLYVLSLSSLAFSLDNPNKSHFFVENKQLYIIANHDIRLNFGKLTCVINEKSIKKTNKTIKKIKDIFTINGINVLSSQYKETDDHTEFKESLKKEIQFSLYLPDMDMDSVLTESFYDIKNIDAYEFTYTDGDMNFPVKQLNAATRLKLYDNALRNAQKRAAFYAKSLGIELNGIYSIIETNKNSSGLIHVVFNIK